jgi:DNA-directed RNA polymerase specialized sigma24 family protein
MSNPPSGSPVTDLVHMYRSGHTQAAEELLCRFAPYLHKWQRLLLYGVWDSRDAELRHFLSMLKGAPAAGECDLRVISNRVRERLKSYDPEDLTQEIQVAFLYTALRCSSIRLHFRYTLHERLIALMKDPVVFSSDRRVPLSTELPAPAEPDIDESWVQGITCGPGFDELSVGERRILRLTKWCGYSTEQVARTLEVSESTITRAIRHAKAILQIEQ